MLPVVFYTGNRTWKEVGSLAALVERADLFGRHIPSLEPLFLNLHALPPDLLAARGGFFGRLLHVVQRSRAAGAAFAGVLREEVQALETLRGQDRARWHEFLSYLAALVYHEREPAERRPMQDLIEASVAAGNARREVQAVRQTIADVLREEGEQRGLERGRLLTHRENLLMLLSKRFGKLPRAIRTAVEAETDAGRLRAWMERVLSANDLADIGISPPAPSP